ncbi:mitochondrial F1F0 ATP synthase subunit F Atp17 [Lineolata rhizophorae]|uniref:Mitochondrial F1F0 ATP synthase subunit F Atp17 n=1 Tax=Lineolata rhizophorae TaxID=578093 RepID=A0A6A6P5B3_9PEZI|nr:mitochondrial F1F0 ATP synthase subunit F Atp17 [Lineolata rhizophorae]
MSYVAKRGISTLIPPKIASPSGIGAAQDAARMNRVVSFYEKLPRGPAPEAQPKSLVQRYQARYFGKNPSAMPAIHIIGGLMLLGYSYNYYFHLRHHKNNAH